MRIEAVTVCVGYHDFLRETLQNNVALVDRLIVITDEADEKTRHLCRQHDIDTILSDDHKRAAGGLGGGKFNKGRMIERGLHQLSQGSWRLHLDADIVLPRQFRRLLVAAHLDQKKIYGCDRVMIPSWEAWQQAKNAGIFSHEYTQINMPQGFSLGTRWVRHDTGYVPIGFFQLWHSDCDEWHGDRIRAYTLDHGGAHRSDVQFALQWDREDRVLLPEIVVAHLESEQAGLGANWNGRTTKPFGPCPQPVTPTGCC